MSRDGSEPEPVDETTLMRRPAEYFDDVEVALVHVAGTLRGALKLERLLTESGIPYAVETDSYVGGLLFRTERIGAFFYVSEIDAERTRELLASRRFKIHHE